MEFEALGTIHPQPVDHGVEGFGSTGKQLGVNLLGADEALIGEGVIAPADLLDPGELVIEEQLFIAVGMGDQIIVAEEGQQRFENLVEARRLFEIARLDAVNLDRARADRRLGVDPALPGLALAPAGAVALQHDTADLDHHPRRPQPLGCLFHILGRHYPEAGGLGIDGHQPAFSFEE